MLDTKRMRMTVSADVPHGVDRDEFAWYIQEAVATWKGQSDPDYPLFDLESSSVEVTDPVTRKVYRDG